MYRFLIKKIILKVINYRILNIKFDRFDAFHDCVCTFQHNKIPHVKKLSRTINQLRKIKSDKFFEVLELFQNGYNIAATVEKATNVTGIYSFNLDVFQDEDFPSAEIHIGNSTEIHNGIIPTLRYIVNMNKYKTM